MKGFRYGLLALFMLTAWNLQAACNWPAWDRFKQAYISEDGRVIDPSDARSITTSEGQSYALFFALAANDRKTFDQILRWTQDNLAKGALNTQLPAWLWGKKPPTAGRCSTPTPPRTLISGSRGRCWRPVVCGRSKLTPIPGGRY